MLASTSTASAVQARSCKGEQSFPGAVGRGGRGVLFSGLPGSGWGGRVLGTDSGESCMAVCACLLPQSCARRDLSKMATVCVFDLSAIKELQSSFRLTNFLVYLYLLYVKVVSNEKNDNEGSIVCYPTFQ